MHGELWYYSSLRVLVDDLYLHTLLGCVHEQKAQGGEVDRCGQYIMQFCDARGPYQIIPSIMEQVFRRFQQIRCAYKSLRYPYIDLGI